MTNNVGFTSSVGDTTWTAYNWYWARQNRIGANAKYENFSVERPPSTVFSTQT